ncbi:MAG: starch-binding protein [Lachnospiraceae bacterium]|nr:starch-binding protein [Lachnospiraceae bacterium]MDE6186125.1 starch-binding protein [Lachnospiraceae bacterium]
MAKRFKKAMTVLFAFTMMLFAFMPMHVKAEEERCVVYVNPPKDWSDPFLWAWDEEGNNAFASWPGGEMEIDSANEGWYYIWIPSWADHMIVSAGEGVQTGELIKEDGNVWVTIADMENAELSNEALTEGEIPAYVEKFKIHVSLPESWESPAFTWGEPKDGEDAGKALRMGEDGWYTGNVPVAAGSIMIIGSAEGQKTEAIAIDPAEVWITVAEDGSFDFTYNDPNAIEAPDISVSVSVPKDWETPCLWAWSAPDGTNVFTSWPGEAFAEGEDGWLTLQVPGWINSIIINANEGNVQTTDISVETGKDVWIVVSGPEEYEVSYEAVQIQETGEEAKETVAQEEAEGADEAATEAPMQAEEEVKSGTNAGVIAVIVIICIIIVGLAVFFAKKKKK